MIIRPEPVNQRLKRGTKLADIPSTPPPRLAELHSPFQLAEYLALKVRYDPHDIEALVEVPTVHEGSSKRRDSEKDLWIYEHLRRLPIDLTPLITSLLPHCTPQSCPQMKADEWQYLCVAHGPEGAEECSAIDYILHTLDSTTTLLNSTEIFPSRLQIPAPSLAHFPSVFRRLSRIFSHAYFHHRETFSLAEAETSLYARFVALCERFALIGSNLLVIPKEATQSGRGDEEDEMEHGRERRSGAEGEVDAELDIDSDSSSSEEEEDDELDNGIGAGTGGRGGHSATSSRGRDKDGEAGGRRPHSLDRHPRPHQFETLQHPEATAASTTTSTSAQPQTQTPQHTHTPLHQIKIRGWSPADIPVATKSSPTTATSTSNPSFDPESMANPVVSGGSLRDRAGQGMTMGRNTLGRNKGRGTMLWSSDSDIPPPLPEKMAAPPVSAPVSHPVAPEEPIASASEAPASETDANISAAYEHGSGLARSESAASTDTAIFTPHQDEQGHISVTSTIAPDPVASVPGGATTADKEEVGKDEIELLQEQGKLEQIPSEAPLAVAPASDTEMAKTAGETDVPPAAEDHEEDLLEEVDLKDANEQDNHGDDKVDASSSAAELGSSAAADVTGEGEGEESIESEVSPSTDTNAHDDKDGNDTSKPDASSADTASAIANKEKGKDGKTDSVDDGGDDKATNGETSEGKE